MRDFFNKHGAWIARFGAAASLISIAGGLSPVWLGVMAVALFLNTFSLFLERDVKRRRRLLNGRR